jgi:hypothetical protein
MGQKTFEPLDLLRFSLPNVLEIDARKTAGNPEFLTYLTGKGWGSYGPLWKRMPRIWKGQLQDGEIEGWWKTTWLIDAMKALRDEYGISGNWYAFDQVARSVGGVKFKSSVRGALFTREFGPEVHVINPRKSQRLERTDLGFLARFAYEEYGRDDPNNPSVAVLDLGSKNRSKERHVSMYRGEAIEMITVEHFDYVINEFLQALRIADLTNYSSVSAVTANMFRIHDGL